MKTNKIFPILILTVFLIFLTKIIIAQPDSWHHEYRFNLFSPDGNLLTCDSLKDGEFSIFEFESMTNIPHYDTINSCFTYSESSWGAIIAFIWIRNSDTMNLFIEPPVGFSNPKIENKSEIEYYLFDTIRFEKGYYWIRSPYDDNLNLTWSEKFGRIITTTSKGMEIHYNWLTLSEFEVPNWEQRIVTKYTKKVTIDCY